MNFNRNDIEEYKSQLISKKRQRSDDIVNKCLFQSIGCEHHLPYIYECYKDLGKDAAIQTYHSELLLKKLSNIEDALIQERQRTFRIEKLLTNFPSYMNRDILKKRVSKKISVNKPNNNNNNNGIVDCSKNRIDLENESSIIVKPITPKSSPIKTPIPNSNPIALLMQDTIPFHQSQSNPKKSVSAFKDQKQKESQVLKLPDANFASTKVPSLIQNTNNKIINQYPQTIPLIPNEDPYKPFTKINTPTTNNVIPWANALIEDNYIIKVFYKPIKTNSEWKYELNKVTGVFALGVCFVPLEFNTFHTPLNNDLCSFPFPLFLIRSDGQYINSNHTPQENLLRHTPIQYNNGDIYSLNYNKNLQRITMFCSNETFTLNKVYCNNKDSNSILVPCLITTISTDSICLKSFNSNTQYLSHNAYVNDIIKID